MTNEQQKNKREPKPDNKFEFFDDCPVCQAMKKQGIKLRWYPDEATGPEVDQVFAPGFSAAKVTPKQVKELRRAFKKARSEKQKLKK